MPKVILELEFKDCIASKRVRMPILPIGAAFFEIEGNDTIGELEIAMYSASQKDGKVATICHLAGLEDSESSGDAIIVALRKSRWEINYKDPNNKEPVAFHVFLDSNNLATPKNYEEINDLAIDEWFYKDRNICVPSAMYSQNKWIIPKKFRSDSKLPQPVSVCIDGKYAGEYSWTQEMTLPDENEFVDEEDLCALTLRPWQPEP